MTAKITGIKEIDKKLAGLNNKVHNKVIRQAGRKAMKPVLAETISNAPVDTGTLKKNIKLKAGKRKKNTISLNVQIGDDAFNNFYPKFVEFGTKKMPANRFMTRAYDSKQDEAKTIAIDEITRGTLREAGK